MKTEVLLFIVSAGLVVTSPTATNLKEICSNEDAELEYERIRFHEMTMCLAKVLNATEFRNEIIQAGDTNKVSSVVTKVCKNLPEIVQCTNEYVSSIGPCMDQEEKREKELWKQLRQMNMEFACGDGREHLINFINEGGIQCIATHRSPISQCVNSKFPALLKQQSDTQIVKTLALITKEDGKCQSLKEVEKCVNSELTKCMEPNSLSIIRQYFSSLDVLFTCVESFTQIDPGSQVEPVGTNLESLQILSEIQDRIEHLILASEQHIEVDEASARIILQHLEEQSAAVQKIINLLDNVVIPRLKKDKKKLPEQLKVVEF